jgi:AAA family ATP:ADP antiporter
MLMFLNVFLLLCAYYFVKPLREGWLSVTDVLGFSPKELKAYSAVAQGIVLLPVVAWYGRLSDRMNRSTLITWATLFCMSNLALFFLWRPGGSFDVIPGIGFVFYIWVSIFGLFVVAQFWTFAADIYTDERGRRLMPMIAIGATGGAAFGSMVVEPMIERVEVGADVLLLAALVPLTASIILTRIVDAREETPKQVAPGGEGAPSPVKPKLWGGLAMIATSRFLIAAAAITLLLNWVNTNGENLLYSVIVDFLKSEVAEKGLTDSSAIEAFTKDGVASFYGNFFAGVNAIALVLQAFVASRLLKYGGFAGILLLLPVVAMVSYAAMAIVPVLFVIKMGKFAENSTDYSINNTARNVLWLPTTSEIKFKCKPAIDTIFVRMGDALAAVTVWIGTAIALPDRGYFAFNVVLVLVWLAAAMVLIREHRKLAEANAVAAGSG